MLFQIFHQFFICFADPPPTIELINILMINRNLFQYISSQKKKKLGIMNQNIYKFNIWIKEEDASSPSMKKQSLCIFYVLLSVNNNFQTENHFD